MGSPGTPDPTPIPAPVQPTADQSGISAPAVESAPDANSLPAGGPVAAPPQAQPSAPTAAHRSFMGDMLRAVGDVLAGGPTKEVVNPQTSAIERQPMTRGEKVKRGIGNVLGVIGSAAGGASGHPVNLIQQQQEQQQKQLKFEADNIRENGTAAQKKLLDQATIVHLSQSTAEMGWRMQREQSEVDQTNSDKLNSARQMVASDPTNKSWCTYDTFADFLKAHSDLQENGVNLHQLQAQGRILTVPVTEGGKVTGVSVFEINPDWSKQKNTEPVIIKRPSGVDGKGNVSY